jgi:hypothetical protein
LVPGSAYQTQTKAFVESDRVRALNSFFGGSKTENGATFTVVDGTIKRFVNGAEAPWDGNPLAWDAPYDGSGLWKDSPMNAELMKTAVTDTSQMTIVPDGGGPRTYAPRPLQDEFGRTYYSGGY